MYPLRPQQFMRLRNTVGKKPGLEKMFSGGVVSLDAHVASSSKEQITPSCTMELSPQHPSESLGGDLQGAAGHCGSLVAVAVIGSVAKMDKYLKKSSSCLHDCYCCHKSSSSLVKERKYMSCQKFINKKLFCPGAVCHYIYSLYFGLCDRSALLYALDMYSVLFILYELSAERTSIHLNS